MGRSTTFSCVYVCSLVLNRVYVRLHRQLPGVIVCNCKVKCVFGGVKLGVPKECTHAQQTYPE